MTMFPTVYGERERRAYKRTQFLQIVDDNWAWVFCVVAFAATFLPGFGAP